jgi:hypothetical protein
MTHEDDVSVVLQDDPIKVVIDPVRDTALGRVQDQQRVAADMEDGGRTVKIASTDQHHKPRSVRGEMRRDDLARSAATLEATDPPRRRVICREHGKTAPSSVARKTSDKSSRRRDRQHDLQPPLGRATRSAFMDRWDHRRSLLVPTSRQDDVSVAKNPTDTPHLPRRRIRRRTKIDEMVTRSLTRSPREDSTVTSEREVTPPQPVRVSGHDWHGGPVPPGAPKPGGPTLTPRQGHELLRRGPPEADDQVRGHERDAEVARHRDGPVSPRKGTPTCVRARRYEKRQPCSLRQPRAQRGPPLLRAPHIDGRHRDSLDRDGRR